VLRFEFFHVALIFFLVGHYLSYLLPYVERNGRRTQDKTAKKESVMGRIMQSLPFTRQPQQEINFIGAVKTKTEPPDEELMSYAEALEKGLIEVTPADSFDGVPHVLVTNHSAWQILLFRGREAIGNRQKRLLTITVTLQHNASVVIPAYLPATTHFLDQGMLSIQKYLSHFNAMDQQAGVVFIGNGKIAGKRYGDFPIQVEVRYYTTVNYFYSWREAAVH
jgi:hypothetical protein